jgi:hypothetical protein
VIGSGIRAISGVASAPGGVYGALVSGAGEAAAEIAEGSAFKPTQLDPNSTLGKVQSIFDVDTNDAPWQAKLKGFAAGAMTPIGRIATEAGIGAVPFGSVLKEGRPIASAARGALYSGVGEAGREFARGEDISPSAVATSAGIGGAITGGLAKILGKRPAAPSTEYVVEPTSRKERIRQPKIKSTATEPLTTQEPTSLDQFQQFMGRRRQSSEIPYSYEYAGGPAAKSAQRDLIATTREEIRDQKNLAAVEKWAAKNKLEADKLARIEGERAAAGVEPQPPTFRTSVSAPGEGGARESMSIGYKAPEEEGEEIGGELGRVLGVPSKGKIVRREPIKIPDDWSPPYGTAAPSVPPSTPPVVSPMPTNTRGIKLSPTEAIRNADEMEALQTYLPVPESPIVHGIESPVAELRRTVNDNILADREPSTSAISLKAIADKGAPAPPKTPNTPLEKVLTPNQQARQESYAALEAKLKGETAPQVGPEVPPVAPPVEPTEVAKAMEGSVAPTIPRETSLERWMRNPGALGAPKGPITPDELTKLQTTNVNPTTIADKVVAARAKYPDEVNAVLDDLAAKRDAGTLAKSGPGSAEAQMAEIRDFFTPGKMRESWKGAPIEGPVAPPIEPTIPGKGGVATLPPEPSSTGGLSQTAKAREAALAKRKANQSPPLPEGATPPKVGKKHEALFEKLKGNKGEIDPTLLAKLGLGLGGAAVGAAVDPFDNRLESAVAGGVAGIGIASMPQILHSLGAAPEALHNLAERIQAPGGIREAAEKIVQTLPQLQRFNYLTSGVGLPANALAGPYGSGVMGAVEHILSGDPRGAEAMKLLRPDNWFREYRTSFEEARQLIGRAEGVAYDEAASKGEKLLAAPGVAMTAGDVATRRLLEQAGFSSEEARRITLTSEPELTGFKKLANLTKGSPLLQMLAPFTRTPSNIGEQGLQRMPGIGFLIQAQRENPDPIRQQIIQQLISTGVGVGSGVLGANLDPETAKIARRYVSNAAGQYSLPASIGFAAGQSVQRGKSPLSPSTVNAALDALPLPTTQPLQDIGKTGMELLNFLSGEGAASDITLPRGSYPAIAKELYDAANPAVTTAKRLPRLRRR